MASRSIFPIRFALVFCLLLAFAAYASTSAHAQEITYDSAPEIGAAAAIVVEYPSGRILYARNEHQRMAPASLTKILTAILALEYGNLGDVVTASPDDIVGESAMGLISGEQQTLRNLMYGMMLPSGNDAAMTIARHLGSTVGANVPSDSNDPIGRFAVMMNVRVQQLGLADSHFLNPHGLDAEGHYSTAYDLASLSWYALHIPEFNSVVSQSYYEAPGHALLNTNEMLTRYEGADGIKTGWTDGCGLCLVTSASRGGHRLISVVLNDSYWWGDSAAILDYGFARLANDPDGKSDPILSVSQSGVVSGLLANPAASLPLPAPLAQGGGAAVSAPPDSAADPVIVSPDIHEPAQAPDLTPLASPGQADNSGLVWAATLLFLTGVGGLMIIRGLGPRFRLPLPASLAESGNEAAGDTSAQFELRSIPTVRASISSQQSRRREPNLLLRAEDVYHLHIERALALAAENKQGSSISEFMQAIRSGGAIEIGDLAEQYQLPAQAFLALARAQVAVGDVTSARQTLLHGVLVLPHERTLRVALFRLPPEDLSA